MTRIVALLRGVNLGKRQVKSADLKAAFEGMGFDNVKTLLASGNVLFDAKSETGLKAKIEMGLKAAFGFEVGTVLRKQTELAALVKADPFEGKAEGNDAKLYVMAFAEPLPKGLKLKDVEGDYAIARLFDREVCIIAHRKPDGTYGAGLLALEKQLPKGLLVTTRNWSTVLKAIA